MATVATAAVAPLLLVGVACVGVASAQLPPRSDEGGSPPGRKVSGVVVDAATNSPVPNARVEYNEEGVVQITATDSKGSFELGQGRLGVVTVEAPGYATNYARWPPFSGQSQLRVLLRPPVPFSGTVYDMATRRPVSDAFVVVWLRSRDGVLTSSATVAESGAYGFANLLPAAGTDRVVYVAHTEAYYAPAIGTVAMDEKNGNRDVDIGLVLEARAAGQVETVTGLGGLFNLGGVVPDTPVTFQAFLDDGSQSGSVTVTIGPGMTQTGIELRFP